MNQMFSFSIFSLLFLTFHVYYSSSKNINFTYSYWNEDKETAENIQIFSRLVSNDNRFWTTSFKKVDCRLEKSEEIEKICEKEGETKAILSEYLLIPGIHNDRILIQTAETIPENVEISKFMVNIFQKFSKTYFTNLAIMSTHFYNSVFINFSNIYEDFEILEPSDFSSKLAEKSKYIHILYVRKQSFEDWEAILHFVDALKRTKLPGGIVDCERHSNICESQNISDGSLPALLAYQNEEIYKQFDLRFEEDQVHDWILTIKQPYITKLSEDAVPYYRSGIVPGFYEKRDTVSMLFIPTKSSVIYQNYAKFAKLNHGKYHLTSMVSKEVEKWAHQPAFLTMKPRDDHIRAFTLYRDITYDRMVEFFEEGAHPSMHEISSARQFSFSLPSDKTLIVFFNPLKSKNSTSYQKFASDQQGILNRNSYYSLVEGLNIFGLYLMDVYKAPIENYLSIRKTQNGYCVNSRPINNENEFSWLRDFSKLPCQHEIDNIQLPISRLQYLERIEDVENLQEELNLVGTQVIHEEL